VPASLIRVVGAHAEEIVTLFEMRMAQLRMPHVDLSSLNRLDERLLAQCDGLATAAEHGQRLLENEFESPTRGGAFALTALAIEGRDLETLDRLFSLAGDTPLVADGLTNAFGWVEPRHLQGVVRGLLQHEDPRRRAVGLATGASHRVNPGLETSSWLSDPAPTVRARALQTAGDLGLTGLAAACVAAMADEDEECQFWGTQSAVLLGNRDSALDGLRRIAMDAIAPYRERAFRLTLQALDTPASHGMLQDLAKNSTERRWLIQGSGIVGDSTYVPWLIGHMPNSSTARLAGEAFTLVTGADLDALQLWKPEPEDFESGPGDDPADENGDLDPDEGLMWPDQQRVEKWWSANSHRFQAGQRYFMGKPVTWEHCIDVLKHGYQRQRVLAAHYLCLLRPGTPLFNTTAPAWRQQRLLAKMS